MSQAEISKSLEALHVEIAQLDTADVAVKEKLLLLIDDIEKQVQNPESSERHETTLQHLPTLIEQFESDHPQLTGTLARLLNTLSGMGI